MLPSTASVVADTTIAKYLDRHAEPEVRLAAEMAGTFRQALVLPASDEPPDFVEGLLPALREGALCIVIVNASNEHPADVHDLNGHTLETIARRASAKRLSNGAWQGSLDAATLLLIDRSSPGRRIPRRQGVGTARKIGCDVATALFSSGRLASRWIHTSDADASLPASFFDAAEQAPDTAVLLAHPFVHVPCGDARVDTAHALYETYLRYYVLGLRWAGSPYAWHTIGSTLAADVRAYAAVRGFPRREAAEDFYLVNKILKLGGAHVPASEPIRIMARRSCRVPFGTGRATHALEGASHYLLYHPLCFALLGAWLDSMEEAAGTGGRSAVAHALERIGAPEHRAVLARALAMVGAEDALVAALRGAPRHTLVRRAHEWFDAFRTRKLIHALRDGGIGALDWRAALERAPFVDARFVAPTEACAALAELESNWR